MDDDQKQLVEQVVGASVSAADLSSLLVRHLVEAKALKPRDALKILLSLHAHEKDLEQRNQHLPGSAHVYGMIASRLETHIEQLKKDTGAKVVVTERMPDGSTRSREM